LLFSRFVLLFQTTHSWCIGGEFGGSLPLKEFSENPKKYSFCFLFVFRFLCASIILRFAARQVSDTRLSRAFREREVEIFKRLRRILFLFFSSFFSNFALAPVSPLYSSQNHVSDRFTWFWWAFIHFSLIWKWYFLFFFFFFFAIFHELLKFYFFPPLSSNFLLLSQIYFEKHGRRIP
jgi:hypothetical protein